MLELFVLETCPYSKKVMEFMKKRGIDYKKKDVSNPENLEMLLELGGEQQVPFLYDEDRNVKMYESDDIIEYVSNLKK